MGRRRIGYPTNAILIIVYLEFILFLEASSSGLQQHSDGVQCSGYCTDDLQKCKTLGGRIMGFCTNALACCDPLIHSSAKCGDVKSGQKIVDFKSPGYPAFGSGDLTCSVKISILKDNIATRVDFVHAEMDGLSFAESENEAGQCESDLVFLRGFENWSPPPRCGNLSGYSFLIDGNTPQTKSMKSLTILALMASRSYRWHIRVVQLLKTKQFSPNQNSVYDSEIPIFNKGKRSLLNPLPVKVPQPPTQDLDQVESNVVENYARPTDNPNSNEDNAKSQNSKFILNGEDTVIGQVPWSVSFRFKLESLNADEVNEKLNANCSIHEGFHFCGGSIIGDNVLLSASHCFYGTSKTNGMVDLGLVKAVVGDTNLCQDSENDKGSFDYDIESVTMHYGYDGNMLINDIAIVKLKTKIQFKEHVKPIKLARTGDDFSESQALLSGWGDYLVKSNKPKDEDDDIEVTEESSTSPPPPTTGESLGEIVTTSATTTTTTMSPQITTTQIVEMDVQNETIAITTDATPTSTSLSTSDTENLTEMATSISITSLPDSTSTTPIPQQSQNASSIEEEIFILETPSILQSSRRFHIQNRTVCDAKDVEQYSATKENVLQYPKYYSLFNSTICTLSVLDGGENGENYRPVSTGKGDSGGALVVMNQSDKDGASNEQVQVGVVSYGIADPSETFCSSQSSNQQSPNRTFDFFASVAFYRSWIDLVILSHEKYSHVA